MWGKTLWVGRVSLPFKNLVTFTDTKFGDGIEAWINLKEEDMAKFERDKELLSCVSTTFNVLEHDFTVSSLGGTIS